MPKTVKIKHKILNFTRKYGNDMVVVSNKSIITMAKAEDMGYPDLKIQKEYKKYFIHCLN